MEQMVSSLATAKAGKRCLSHYFLGFLLLAAVLVACMPPGVGPKAERGYRCAAPVIAALEEYRQAEGEYPVTLQELVPEYLPQNVLEAPECEWDHYPLDYERTEAGYELTFRYVAPA
jgi:hypothetical protein